MILYHGSQCIIEKPVFGAGNIHNDYGLGFYCTESLELAKEWACSFENSGYANQYEFSDEGLTTLNLTSGSYHILNWLAVLLENRTFRINNDLAQQGKEYILTNFMPEYKDKDVVIGYRADDSYFSFAQAFLSNTISLAKLEKAMVLGKLGVQIVPKSEKAFSRLHFLSSIPVEGAIYYPRKMARDQSAREEYRRERSNPVAIGERYLLDILREEWRNDDPRLQRVILG